MRKYWHLITNSFQEHLAYRLNLGLEVAGGVVYTLVLVWIWRAIASSGLSHSDLSLSVAQITTYFIGAGILGSYFFLAAQGEGINDDINLGFVSGYLVKPVKLLAYWFIRDHTRKPLTFLFGVGGFIIIAAWYRTSVVLPASFLNGIIFFVFVVLAGVLHFFLYATFALLAFWSVQTWGERFILNRINELASGMLVPIALFPTWFQHVLALLPFRYFISVPMLTYLGVLSPRDILSNILGLVIWIAILWTLAIVVMRRGLRVYAGEGI